MTDLLVALHGPSASLDHRCGDPVAMVGIKCPVDGRCVDFERDRLWVSHLPGPDRWLSGSTSLLLARISWWGFYLVDDTLPDPLRSPDPRPRPARRDGAPRKVPHLPHDMASCPCCGRLVLLLRDTSGLSDPLVVSPSRRVAKHAESLMIASGLMPFVAWARGVGQVAGRDHRLDCCRLPPFVPFAPCMPWRAARLARSLPSDRPPVLLPWEVVLPSRPARPARVYRARVKGLRDVGVSPPSRPKGKDGASG